MRYSEDEALAASGNPNAENPKDRCPSVSPGAEKFILEGESVASSLFELADVFRIPVTNNIPWFEDGDIDRPIYHVGEFIEIVEKVFLHHGWKRP